MIGIFDSGFGGLQTLKYFYRFYPQYEYVFLADTAYVPYGNKDGIWIQHRLFTCLHWLFSQGCKIIIVACNTAAAYGIRARQTMYPDKKALSISIPGVEKALALKAKNVGIIATKATVLSGIYEDLFERIRKNLQNHALTPKPLLQCKFSLTLVPLIEEGKIHSKETKQEISRIIKTFSPLPDVLILGCTHFPIVLHYRKKYYTGPLVDPSWEAAVRFGLYLDRHPDIKENLLQTGHIRCYVTGCLEKFMLIGPKIRPMILTSKNVEIKKVPSLCFKVS